MTRQPRAFFALDLGSATTSAALLGHIGGRWRLVAHAAAPASTDLEALLVGLLDGVQRADPEILAELGAEEQEIAQLAATWPRLEARSTPQRRITVLAGSRRQRKRLEDVASRAGWLVVGGSADEDDQVQLGRLAYSPETQAILFGADDSPGGDEKRHLPLLAALLGAAARCRPELTIVLAGGAAAHETAFWEGPGGHAAGETAHHADPKDSAGAASSEPGTEAVAGSHRGATAPVITAGALSPGRAAGAASDERYAAHPGSRSGHVLLAPDAEAGQPAGVALQQVLEGLRALPNESRLGVARSIASLASVLDRSVEAVEIGLDGGLRCRAEPYGQGSKSVVSSHGSAAGASLAPIDPSEEIVESVLAWSTTSPDRYRLTDRLCDLRQVPWGEVDGEGALFRLAAAKAAVERLVEATPEISACPMPDLIVAGGGVWASFPPAVVALALADLTRRPGVTQLACDHARLLGPLGAIEDEDERRRLLADLADDLLVPLGSLILAGGLRAGRSAGRMRIRRAAPAAMAAEETGAETTGAETTGADQGAADGASGFGKGARGTAKAAPGAAGPEEAVGEIELEAGRVEVLALPPGQRAIAEIEFRDTVRLVGRGRRFAVEVTGGLGGLLVDLRDIPLRLPDRPEQRRAALEAWQRLAWPGLDE